MGFIDFFVKLIYIPINNMAEADNPEPEPDGRKRNAKLKQQSRNEAKEPIIISVVTSLFSLDFHNTSLVISKF